MDMDLGKILDMDTGVDTHGCGYIGVDTDMDMKIDLTMDMDEGVETDMAIDGHGYGYEC